MSRPIISIRATPARDGSGIVTESGLFKGTHPLDTPLWQDGRNVIFRDGGPEKIPGWVSVLDGAAEGVIRGMGALQDEASVQRLFWGDQATLSMWDGATVDEIGTGYTGHEDEASTHPATAWSFARFGNFMLATNGKDTPQIWRGSGDFDDVGGDPGEKVTNGNFTTNLAGWTAGAGWAWASSTAKKTAGTASDLSQTVSLTATVGYKLSFGVANQTNGTLTAYQAGEIVIAATGNGTYEATFLAAAGDLTFSADAKWDGQLDGVSVMPATAFTRAEIFLIRGPHVVAFNTSNGKSWIEWSDADNPEVWTNTSTNAARNLPIRDMDGEIRAAVHLGEQIAVLGKNDLYIVSYEGEPFYFTYQPALKGIGAVGKMAVVEANRILYGFGPNGIWMTDGVTYSYIDTLALRGWIAETIDTTQLSKVAATYDASTETVMWSLPTAGTGEPTITVAYRIPNASWSIYGFGRTSWVPQLGVYPQPVGAGADGAIYFHNEGVDADGAALEAWVQTRPFATQDARGRSFVDALALQLRRLSGDLQVRLGGQNDLSDAISWAGPALADDGFRPIRLRKGARFVSIEIRSNDVGADFAMSGFDLYGTQSGRIG